MMSFNLAKRFFVSKSDTMAVAWFTPIGVIGSGIMGSGIACTAAINGFQVTLVDVNDSLLAKGMSFPFYFICIMHRKQVVCELAVFPVTSALFPECGP